MTHKQNDKRDWKECDNAISLDEEFVIDVPKPYHLLNEYCASLGHKANHAFPPDNNCIYYPYFNHPIFGKIKCLKSVKAIEKDEEILVDYGYDENDAPSWYHKPAH